MTPPAVNPPARRRDPQERSMNSEPDGVLATLVVEYSDELVRFADRFSLCTDDAQDACQRALEIMLRLLRRREISRPLSYLRTVIRYEAIRVRRQRVDVHRQDFLSYDSYRDSGEPEPHEHAERFEYVAHVAVALKELKPQETIALQMRAEGHTYKEICAITSWSYTRCNRCVTEGRRSLLERLRAGGFVPSGPMDSDSTGVAEPTSGVRAS
jgi:RNA polymerase sigma factor (sigma-70 family)